VDTALIWAEIDLDAISSNIRALRSMTAEGTRFMAVVKADAYGHGALAVARQALAAGADWLAVARLEEGIALRQAGIQAPILVFGYTPPALAADLLAHDLTATVYDFDTARAYSQVAVTTDRNLRVHLKVDTGMGRLGLRPELGGFSATGKAVSGNPVFVVDAIAHLPGIELEGVYTHFAAADHPDQGFASAQLERFTDFLDHLYYAGIEVPLRHAANSAATITLPDSHLDMVRCGVAMYGLYPSAAVGPERIPLTPAMAFKCRIVQLKRVEAGFAVSYGMTHVTEASTVIATVAAGYADGLSRRLSNAGEMLVRGRRVPIVGRVCMDLTMLDTGAVPEAEVGDEAVIFGRQGEETISVDEVAARLGTIHYEVVTGVAARVPRFYRPDGAGAEA
jgi:alanine racemase